MKHLRKFSSVEAMQAEIETAAVDFVGLAYDAQEGTAKVNIAKEVPPDYSKMPFYIDVRGTVTLAATTGLQMSTDGKTWTDTTAMTLPTGKTYFRVASDQTSPLKPNWTENENSDYDIGGNINSLVKISFENNTTCYNFYASNTGFFQNKSKLKSAGNLILPATTSLVSNCYKQMFQRCTLLTTAPALPATKMADYCYQHMFNNCSSLTTAPELPATTLANYCYQYMFSACSKLTAAPTLPATTLAGYCYQNMFAMCSKLTTAPALPATTLASHCYESMFLYCTSLVAAPAILPAEKLVDNCYLDMFNGCITLTTAPELPATTLASQCYVQMFNECTSLTTAPALPATTLADTCYSSMFQGCTSLTTAPELAATKMTNYCYQNMFYGCTSLTTAPELPATTLVYGCYFRMFQNCTNLNYIKCLATDISATQCTKEWVKGVASSGTFVKKSSMSSWTTGVDGKPSGWTVQNA